MLNPVQMIASLVGSLSISGSCGQLLVYEMLSLGRLVEAAQADQKKKEASCLIASLSVRVFFGMAYSVWPSVKSFC